MATWNTLPSMNDLLRDSVTIPDWRDHLSEIKSLQYQIHKTQQQLGEDKLQMGNTTTTTPDTNQQMFDAVHQMNRLREFMYNNRLDIKSVKKTLKNLEVIQQTITTAKKN